MDLQTQDLFEAIDSVRERMKQISRIRAESRGGRGYILSVEEDKALPKYNAWEWDFVNNLTLNLHHGFVKRVSPKQAAIINKLYDRIVLNKQVTKAS